MIYYYKISKILLPLKKNIFNVAMYSLPELRRSVKLSYIECQGNTPYVFVVVHVNIKKNYFWPHVFFKLREKYFSKMNEIHCHMHEGKLVYSFVL